MNRLPAVLDERLDHVHDLDPLVLGAVRHRCQARLGPVRRVAPALGEIAPPLCALALLVHHVDAAAVGHREPLRAAAVGVDQALHLREELDPVRPAVGQHVEAVERPANDLVLRPGAHERQRVGSVAQTQFRDAGAVVEPRDRHGRHQLVRRDARLRSEPFRVRRVSRARAERDETDARDVAQHVCDRRRGVRVVEDPGSGRDLGGVPRDRFDHGQVAERAHDAARADRVRDMHEDAVASRDLDVVLPRRHATDRDGDDHEIGAHERLALVGGALDRQVGALVLDQGARERVHHREPAGIDVHQRERPPAHAGRRQEAAQQQGHEHAASATDDRDLERHRAPFFMRHRAALPHPTAQLFIICTGEPTRWFDAVQRIKERE